MSPQRGRDDERGPIPVGDVEHLENWDAENAQGGYWCVTCKQPVAHRSSGPWSRCPVCIDKGVELPPRPEKAS